jgi:hypothetical protein
MALLAGFGRPAEVAACYRPTFTIIDPTDSRSFLKASVVGVALGHRHAHTLLTRKIKRTLIAAYELARLGARRRAASARRARSTAPPSDGR